MILTDIQKSYLFWLRILIFLYYFLTFFPIIFVWAYELEDYFGINYPAIAQFNELELSLSEGSFLLSENQTYILIAIIMITGILLFFRFKIGKIFLIPIILWEALYSIEGLFDVMYYHPLFPLINYINGFLIGIIFYLTFFSPIKNIFVKSFKFEINKFKK